MTNFSLINLSFFNTIFNDAPLPWQYGFQDSAAPGFTGLVTLHNTIGFYLIVIFLAVAWVLFSIMYYYSENKNPIAHKYLTHGTVLELIWTIKTVLEIIGSYCDSFHKESSLLGFTRLENPRAFRVFKFNSVERF